MKTFITALLILALIPVVAAPPGNGVGDIDTECARYGFDFGIAKWEYSDNGFFLAESNPGYTTLVNGTNSHAYWWSTPDASGVLSKEGQDYQFLAGGASGEVFQGAHGISHLTLCGEEGEELVPEFGLIATLGVIALAGIFVIRRR